jgi:hypothetical protein
MDWKRAIDEERAALERIVALLLALADLAELACCRGASAGRLVLAILRPAEVARWQFLDDTPDMSRAATGRSGSTCEELACLAARLRAFAAMLACWAKLACPSCGRQSSPSLPNPAGRPQRATSGYDLFGPPHVDTS